MTPRTSSFARTALVLSVSATALVGCGAEEASTQPDARLPDGTTPVPTYAAGNGVDTAGITGVLEFDQNGCPSVNFPLAFSDALDVFAKRDGESWLLVTGDGEQIVAREGDEVLFGGGTYLIDDTGLLDDGEFGDCAADTGETWSLIGEL